MRTFTIAMAIAMASFAFPVLGQLQAPSGQLQEAVAAKFDSARLEQLVAPVALYPDSLLMQVFMAATYPLEVVEADRFVKANPGASQASLQTALVDKTWDPSVKALAGFPDVLKMMSENVEWTRDLGDAFLSQQSDLLDAVQRMRQKARASGNLQTTSEEVVTARDDGIVAIEPTDPSVVYVPTYSPYVVYGSGWSYPYWYYPHLYGYWPRTSGISFSFGYGDWLWGYPTWGWGVSSFFIDSNRYNWFNRRTGHHWSQRDYASGSRFQWRHDPEHRGGVRYRDPAVSSQYSGTDSWRRSREEARGFVTQPAAPRVTPSPAPRVNPAPTPRFERTPTPRVERSVPKFEQTPAPRSIERAPARRIEPIPTPRIERAPAPRVETPRQVVPRAEGTWKGSREPSFDRESSERGSKSRGGH